MSSARFNTSSGRSSSSARTPRPMRSKTSATWLPSALMDTSLRDGQSVCRSTRTPRVLERVGSCGGQLPGSVEEVGVFGAQVGAGRLDLEVEADARASPGVDVDEAVSDDRFG